MKQRLIAEISTTAVVAADLWLASNIKQEALLNLKKVKKKKKRKKMSLKKYLYNKNEFNDIKKLFNDIHTSNTSTWYWKSFENAIFVD